MLDGRSLRIYDAPVSFADALQSQVPPGRVGEVRLRFEESLLIGERAARPGLWPEALGVLALGSGLGTLTLLTVDGSLLLACGLAVLSAAFTGTAISTRGRLRSPERFVLNFATESLRLDAPSRAGKATCEVVPFDSVVDLRVVPTGRHGFGLALDYAGADGGTRATLLVKHSGADEIDDLRRLWRVLRHAFGLRPSAA